MSVYFCGTTETWCASFWPETGVPRAHFGCHQKFGLCDHWSYALYSSHREKSWQNILLVWFLLILFHFADTKMSTRQHRSRRHAAPTANSKRRCIRSNTAAVAKGTPPQKRSKKVVSSRTERAQRSNAKHKHCTRLPPLPTPLPEANSRVSSDKEQFLQVFVCFPSSSCSCCFASFNKSSHIALVTFLWLARYLV